MSIVRAIKVNHFETMERRGWDKTYWFFDLHSTVIKPNYEANNIPKEFYPMAKYVLQELSKRDDIVMIMYTCSHPHEIVQYVEFFKEHNIEFSYVNENPEVTNADTSYGCYDKKPYMNVLLEDKAGFNAEEDWFKIAKFMKFKDITQVEV